MWGRIVLAVVVALLAAISEFIGPGTAGAAPAGTYTYTDLGAFAHPQINATGQVVGTVMPGITSEPERAVLWQHGILTELGGLPGGKGSGANSINDQGQVVGWAGTPAGATHAVIWHDGTITDLGTLPNGKRSEALGINNAGQVVGSSFTAAGPAHAVVWQQGTITDLGILPGGKISAANGINSAGQVVGLADTTDGDEHAVVWQQGTITDLGTLPGGKDSEAAGINSAGQVAGYSDNADGSDHAVLWQHGVVTDLGTLPGGKTSHAVEINNQDQVVGWSFAADGVHHDAVLWQHGTIIALNDLFPTDFDQQLYDATDINEAGQIVGTDARIGGAHAYLLTPTRAPGLPNTGEGGVRVTGGGLLGGGVFLATALLALVLGAGAHRLTDRHSR
jgi:probable HAF family extracellular repeat protein